MKAKEYLEQVRKLDVMIDSKVSEICSIKEIAYSISQVMKSEPVQTSGTSDKVGNCVSRYVDLEKEVNAEIDRLVDLRSEIMKVMNKADLTAEEYKIIYARYFKYESWGNICSQMFYSKRAIQNKHHDALTKIDRIIE